MARAKSALVFGLKAGATLALLAFALSRVNLAGLAGALGGLGFATVSALVLLTFAQVALSALRWHRVLAFLGERVPARALFLDSLVGTTYNMLLPTTVGGDVVRALRCRRRTSAPEAAWASVVYERMMGLVCLALVPLAALLAGAVRARPIYLIVAAASSAVFVAGLAFAHAPLRWVGQIASGRAPRIAGFSHKLAEAFAGPLAGPRPRLETFAWSLAYQLVALFMLVVAGQNFENAALYRAAYVGAPLVLIVSMLPVTVAGLGLRESLFVTALPEFGVGRDQAGLFAFVWLASNLACALAGALVLMTDPTPLPEVTKVREASP